MQPGAGRHWVQHQMQPPADTGYKLNAGRSQQAPGTEPNAATSPAVLPSSVQLLTLISCKFHHEACFWHVQLSRIHGT
eukprot:1160191-Pelagomonas_calceolata.AAC.6